MRFNSTEYLEKWEKTGQYPKIHNDIAFLFEQYSKGNRVLDLCCSSGLLGERLHRKLGVHAVGIDGDRIAIEKALKFGVSMQIHHLKIKRQSLKDVVQIIENDRLNTIIARRCVPELFADDIEFGYEFAHQMKNIGIKEIFLEGRAKTKSSNNKLNSLNKEVAVFSEYYKLVKTHKNTAYLRSIE